MKAPRLSIALLLLALGGTGAAAQVTPTITPTSLPARRPVSEAAAAALASGMTHAEYNFAPRAARDLARAVEAAPDHGLARVMYAQYAPGLTRDQRIAQMDRGVADAAAGSTEELLAALAHRERFVKGPAAARPLTRALAEMVPDQPRYAMLDAMGAAAGAPERVAAFRQVVQRFPEYGAAYNTLAYELFNAGDLEGALEAARTQVRLAGDQPNPHDTYAELLQWAGRLDEARTHYRHAVEVAPDFMVAHVGLAEVDQLQGRGEAARRVLNAALPGFSHPEEVGYLKRAMANSWLADGNAARAEQVLAELVRDEAADHEAVSDLHLRMALADAALGRGQAVAEHLRQARAAEGAEGMYDGVAALAYALAGQAGPAREHADRFAAQAAESDNAEMRRHARMTRGYAQMAEGDCAGALETFGDAPDQDGVAALGRATCLARTGRRAEAREVRERALATTRTELEDWVGAIARGALRRGR